MDQQQLREALTSHAPEQASVMAKIRSKKRRRTRVRISSAFASAILVTGSVILMWPHQPRGEADHSQNALPQHTLGALPPKTDSPSPKATAGMPAAACADLPLKDHFAEARRSGATVVIAHATLTGRFSDGPEIFAEASLHSVQVLSGPPVTNGFSTWISGARGRSGPFTGTDSGALWAPDGRMLAIIWRVPPPDQPTNTIETTIRVAPIVGEELILSTAGCWSARDLPSTPFTGRLSEIPGSDSYARAAERGFHAVPLSMAISLARP